MKKFRLLVFCRKSTPSRIRGVDSGPGAHERNGGGSAGLVKAQGNQDDDHTGRRGLPGADGGKSTPGDQVEEPSNEASPATHF